MKEIIEETALLETPAEPLILLKEDKINLNKEEGDEIVSQLKEVLEANPDLKALSAPQIGIGKRVFCIKFDDGIRAFINPIITKKGNYAVAPETFGSLPGHEILIARPMEITTVYYTEDFKYEENKLLDGAARLFDQQAQLLDGVLPTELGLVSNIEEDGRFIDATPEERDQLLEIYKKFVAAKAQRAMRDAEADEEAHKHFKDIRFMEDVVNGRAEVVAPPEPSQNRAQRRAAEKRKKRLETKKRLKRKGSGKKRKGRKK